MVTDEQQEPSTSQPYVTNNAFSHRLIVVANRLPVIAAKDKEGNWALQARPHTSDTVFLLPLPSCRLPRPCSGSLQAFCLLMPLTSLKTLLVLQRNRLQDTFLSTFHGLMALQLQWLGLIFSLLGKTPMMHLCVCRTTITPCC